MNFDYFSANCSFVWNYWIKAQYCWAHLIREIRFLSEKHPDAKTKAWAEQLLERSRRLFSAWHRRDEMTAIATCKKQNRNFFSFLYDSIVAHLHHQPAPSLLGK